MITFKADPAQLYLITKTSYYIGVKQVTAISVKELSDMAGKMYGDLVKAVVDLKKQLLVVDAEMHVDEEQFLLENGSNQEDLWGINLYPDAYGTEQFVKFDSMVNIRPSQKNLSRGVENEITRRAIIALVNKIVTND